MIKAKFEIVDGKTMVLTVKGHANFGEKGKDILCSSASILTYTLAQIVQTLNDAKKLKKKPTIRLDEGDAVITCKPTKDKFNEVLYAFRVIQIGFALLASSYPDYFELTQFGER